MVLRLLLFCIYLVLLGAEVGSAIPDERSMVCRDMISCLEVHLQNPELLRLLSGRCKLGELSDRQPATRRITFSHLPKAGGSSINLFLNKYAQDRVRLAVHEHFLLSAQAEPDNIFVTMMREPVSRALSFYCYVNDRAHLHKEALINKLWVHTFRAEPVQWSANPFMQRTLYQDPLGFFLRDVTNITDSISKYDYNMIKALPEAPLKDTIPGTLDAFLAYTSALPEEYQCRQHLEVGFIFLKHYEVVGTLEKRADFFRVFLRRAHFPPEVTLNHTDMHENSSKFKLAEKDREAMVENLKRPLYCATVLWRIAGMISEQDVSCVPNVDS
jgi:hypothetical protein